MNDLSELIKECKPLAEARSINYEALAKARRLGDLGFYAVAKELSDRVLLAQKLEEVKAEGYLAVTPAKIKSFLERRAAAYNEGVMKTYSEKANNGFTVKYTTLSRSSTSISQSFGWSAPTPGVFAMLDEAIVAPRSYIRFTAPTNDFLSPAKDRISGFAWEEVPVKEYKAIPPDHALEALKVARDKEIFHDFTIASVSHVKDPLLLGVLEGVEDRFFLAQWGEDVALDDVI